MGNAVIYGSYSYSINPSADSVTLTASQIEDVSFYGAGTIRLELWVTTSPWNKSGSNTGWEIATDQMGGSSNGTLGAYQSFYNVSGTVAYQNHPPAGTYYITLGVAEYTGATPGVDNGFVIDSAYTFSNYMVVDSAGNVSNGGSISMPLQLPSVYTTDQTIYTNSSILASSLVASTYDPNNLSITYYGFRDDGGGGGHLLLNGVAQPDNTWINVSAADLPKLSYVAGSSAGSEVVDVEVYDGQWSQYSSATVTTQAPPLPVVIALNQTVTANTSISAASLIAWTYDPNNYAITSYAFRDDGGSGGHLVLNGVVESDNTWITVSAADLSKLSYVAGSSAGSESVDVAVYDGQWSSSDSSLVTTQSRPLPVVYAQNQTISASASIAASSLIWSTYDPNNLQITSYGFRDEGGGGGHLVLNGVVEPDNTWITVSAADLPKLSYVGGSGAGSEFIDVAAYDGQWSSYDSALVTTQAALPVVFANDETVNASAYIHAASFIQSVQDPNNRAISGYAFRDDGSGGGHFILDGVPQLDHNWIIVGASDLSRLIYVGGAGAGAETVDVAAWDGQWSLYESVTATTLASQSNLPTLAASNQAVFQNTSIAASTLIASVSDPNGLPITSYGFRDDGTDGGHLAVNGVAQSAGNWVVVSAANLSTVTYVGGAKAGTEIVGVEVFDGHWSVAEPAFVTTLAALPPSVLVNNRSVTANASIAASSLVASTSDPNNLQITKYEFRDDGTGGGHFALSGAVQSANTWITVSAADLSKLVYVGGSAAGTETVDIGVYDGSLWSATQTATVITQGVQQGQPAVIVASNHSVMENNSFQASALIASVTDPNNNPITDYNFRDDGAGGGYFSLNGVKQAANAWVTISANNLATLVYVGGAVPGTETVDLSAWNGFAWSSVASASVTTTQPANALPVVTAHDQSVGTGAAIQAASLIASVTDPNNLAITQYDFRDEGSGGGHFSLNGVAQASNTWIAVGASDLSKLLYVGGASQGSETVDVAAYDGQWSNYDRATVVTVAPALPVVVASDQTLAANSSLSASAFVASTTDPNNYAITSYQFRDDTNGSGHFVLSGVAQPANTWITVSAGQLSSLSFVAGGSASSENVDVAVYDGHAWSNFATAQVTTNGAKAPNQVLSLLSDTGVRADVTAQLSGNSLGYSGMLKILQDAASGGISASEFGDLKTLVAHFNATNGISVSPYVAYISDKLVNGDAWNSTWTGGAVLATALGNLATGTSAANADELIQKWFLGGDLPSPIFDNSLTASYSVDARPVYDLSGKPSINDINQGDLGDCYLLASLAEVAQCEPDTIKSMITDNGNDTYGVRFYINANPVYVTVNRQLPFLADGHAAGNSSPDLWSSLVEKAYVELNSEPGFLDHTAGNVYDLIDSGWADPITQITGRTVQTFDSAYYSASSWAQLKSIFVNAIQNNQEVDLASYGDAKSAGQQTFVAGHMFSSIGYDSATGEFVVRNPWGSETGQYWATQFEATMADIFNVRGTMFVASAGAAAAPKLGTTGTAVDASAAIASYTAGTLHAPVALSDTVADVQAAIGSLQSLASAGLLSSISLQDTGLPRFSLSSSQVDADSGVLSRINGNYALAVAAKDGGDTVDLSFHSGANDTVTGGSGNDVFYLPRSGTLAVAGGSGRDTVYFAGSKAMYLLGGDTANYGSGSTITLSDATDGQTVNLTNVERVAFSDGADLAFDTQGDAGQAYRLYQAAFNRTPDANGLGYWISTLDNGAALNDVAQGFVGSSEFSNTYGSLDNTGFVSQLYQNVLHRAGEQAGVDYWSGHLTAHDLTRAEVLALFSESPENQSAVIGVISSGMTYVPFG